jgi:alpha-L-rhamnosidase
MIPDIAPEMTVFGGGFRDEVNWGDAFVLTPYFLYTTYGDADTMRAYYAPMRDYVAYLRSRASNGLLSGDLGDWIAGDGSTPATATGTYGYYTTVATMAKIADALGKSGDAASYAALASSIADAFNAAFYDPATQSYGTATSRSQAMDALPLQMGIVPAGAKQAVLDDLVARIDAYHPNGGGPHISGGTVSLQPIYEVLMDNGRGDVLWDVLQQTTAPSYANFIAQGRTTIPEAWNFGGSQNHMILLQIDEWFNAGLAGIRQAPGSIGFDKLIIKPQAVGDLTHVDGSYETPHGTVASRWTKGAHGISSMHVSVPAGSTATVYVPASAGQSFLATGGSATPAGRVEGYEVFDVQPGKVTFHRSE